MLHRFTRPEDGDEDGDATKQIHSSKDKFHSPAHKAAASCGHHCIADFENRNSREGGSSFAPFVRSCSRSYGRAGRAGRGPFSLGWRIASRLLVVLLFPGGDVQIPLRTNERTKGFLPAAQALYPAKWVAGLYSTHCMRTHLQSHTVLCLPKRKSRL